MEDAGHVASTQTISTGLIIKRAVFGAFYEMQKDMKLGERFFYLSTIMMVLQLMYFPVARRVAMPWPEVVTSHVSYIFEIYDYTFLQYETDWAVYLQMSISATMTILATIGVIVLSVDEAKEETTYKVIIPFVEILLRFVQTVLFIPFVGIFMKMIICPSTLSVCTTNAGIALQIVGIFLLVALWIIASLNAVFMVRFSRFNDSGKIIERCFGAPHGRVELMNTWIRGVLAITLTTIPKDGSISIVGQAIWITMLTVCGILLVGMYYRYFPFLKMKWNLFSIMAYGVYLWACISLIVCRLIDNPSDLTGALLFCLVIPIFLYCLVSLAEKRIAYLTSAATKEELVLSPYIAEVRLRLLYVHVNEKGVFKFGKTVEAACKEVIEKYPSSAYLRLYVAGLCGNSKRLVFALNIIREAKETKLSIDQEFFLHCLNRRNMERHGEASGAASFVTFDTQITEARESLGAALKTTARFWKMLSRSRFTLNELVEQGAKIHHQAQIAKKNIHRLLSLSRSNTEAIRLYATYINYIMNDSNQANRIMERANTSTSADDSGGYAVCTISGNTDSLGKVLEVTQATCTMFGYPKRDMVGQNINFLMPPPLDRMHDTFIENFLASDADFVAKTRALYVLHSEGYIFPVELTITPSTNEDSDLIFIGQFKSKIDPTKHLVMADAHSNLITACSQGASDILDIDMDQIFTMNVHILNIFPDFFSDDQGNSPYFAKNTERQVILNGYELMVDAKKMLYESKEDSNIQFSVGFIMISFRVIRNINDCGHDAEEELEDGAVKSEEEQPEEEENDAFTDAAPSIRRRSMEHKPLLQKTQRNARKHSDDSSEEGSIKEENKSVRSGRSGTKSLGKSMATGSVGSSVTDSTELSINKIHRLITARLKKKDPRMKRFQRFVKYFTITCIALAIARVVAVSMWYRSLIVRSDYAHISFQRNSALMGIVMLVEQARNGNIDLENSTIYRMLPYNTTDKLLSKLDLLTGLHLEIVDGTAGNGGIDDEILYGSSVSQTQNGLVFEDVSFHIGIMQFIRNVENYVLTDLEQCKESCRFILNNGPFALFSQSLYHSYVYVQETLTLSDSILTVALFSVIFISVFLVFSFVIGFAPMFQMTKKRKEVLGDAFRSIPPETMRQLQRRAERRVRIVQTATTVVADDLNLAEEDEEADADEMNQGIKVDNATIQRQNSTIGGMFSVGIFGKILSKKKAAKISPNLKSQPIVSSETPQKKVSPELSARRIHFRKETVMLKIRQFVWNLISVAFIFWVVLIFFTIISVIDFEQIPNIRSTVSALEASGLRESYLDSLQFWLTKDPNNTSSGFRENYNSHMETTIEHFEKAKMYDDALMLGNATMDVRSFKASSGDLYELYFGNACGPKCVLADTDPRNAYIPTDLSMVEDLRHGLVLTLQRYWENAQQIIKAKLAFMTNATDDIVVAFYSAQSPLLNLQLYYSLSDQSDLAANYYNLALNSLVAEIRSVKIILITVFCFVMVVVYFATLQVFKKMDKELKNAQTLLYMLPLEVFENVPEMMALITNSENHQYK